MRIPIRTTPRTIRNLTREQPDHTFIAAYMHFPLRLRQNRNQAAPRRPQQPCMARPPRYDGAAPCDGAGGAASPAVPGGGAGRGGQGDGSGRGRGEPPRGARLRRLQEFGAVCGGEPLLPGAGEVAVTVLLGPASDGGPLLSLSVPQRLPSANTTTCTRAAHSSGAVPSGGGRGSAGSSGDGGGSDRIWATYASMRVGSMCPLPMAPGGRRRRHGCQR